MGASKTELFLPRIVAAAKPVFDEVIAVQRAGGVGVGMIPTIYEEGAAEAAGAPLFGVVAALGHASGRCFVLAVDYPFVTSDLLRELRDREGVPMWDGQPQPLCATWDPAWLPLIERRIAEGRLDLRGLIAEANVEIIPESLLRARHGGEPLRNVNTPEELQDGERLDGR